MLWLWLWADDDHHHHVIIICNDDVMMMKLKTMKWVNIECLNLVLNCCGIIWNDSVRLKIFDYVLLSIEMTKVNVMIKFNVLWIYVTLSKRHICEEAILKHWFLSQKIAVLQFWNCAKTQKILIFKVKYLSQLLSNLIDSLLLVLIISIIFNKF